MSNIFVRLVELEVARFQAKMNHFKTIDEKVVEEVKPILNKTSERDLDKFLNEDDCQMAKDW